MSPAAQLAVASDTGGQLEQRYLRVDVSAMVALSEGSDNFSVRDFLGQSSKMGDVWVGLLGLSELAHGPVGMVITSSAALTQSFSVPLHLPSTLLRDEEIVHNHKYPTC